jgi:type IV pilus assembly protein PilE
MAIVAILASIAYPSYMKTQRETRRNDAYSGLFEIKSIIDNYTTINNNTDFSAWTAATANTNIKYPATSKSGFYTFTILAFDAYPFTYNIQATAVGSQANDTNCPTISLSSSGTKSPSICW